MPYTLEMLAAELQAALGEAGRTPAGPASLQLRVDAPPACYAHFAITNSER